MSLPASQRRALNQIEKALADDHPSLWQLFAIFTRLTGHEALPVTEQVTDRRRWWQRWMRPGVAAVVGLAMATGALLALSLMVPGPPPCAPGAVSPVAVAHTWCAPQQNKLSRTSPSGP